MWRSLCRKVLSRCAIMPPMAALALDEIDLSRCCQIEGCLDAGMPPPWHQHRANFLVVGLLMAVCCKFEPV